MKSEQSVEDEDCLYLRAVEILGEHCGAVVVVFFLRLCVEML